MNHSYAMGVSKNIEELKKEGFNIESDDEDYMVSFPKGKEDTWEKYILKDLSNGYWNEYIGENIIFIFKFNDGTTQKYILDETNSNEILKLCCEFAETKFNSIEEMIMENEFYKSKINYQFPKC